MSSAQCPSDVSGHSFLSHPTGNSNFHSINVYYGRSLIYNKTNKITANAVVTTVRVQFPFRSNNFVMSTDILFCLGLIYLSNYLS